MDGKFITRRACLIGSLVGTTLMSEDCTSIGADQAIQSQDITSAALSPTSQCKRKVNY
jgi:hypothetical protein